MEAFRESEILMMDCFSKAKIITFIARHFSKYITYINTVFPSNSPFR